MFQWRDGFHPMIFQIEFNDGYGSEELPVNWTQNIRRIDFDALHKSKELKFRTLKNAYNPHRIRVS